MINFSEEGIFLSISYFIPGFLINILISSGMYLKNSETTLVIYRYLLLSIINIFLYNVIDEVWYFIFGLYTVTNTVFVIFIRNILLPAIIGIVIVIFMGKTTKNSQISYILHFLGFSKEALTTSAWDYVFYSQMKNGGCYLTITLKDGTKIYGLFGNNSFASNHKFNNSDIFLEKTFIDFENFEPNNSGILISKEDILAISFYVATE